jgi:hypothetical protein
MNLKRDSLFTETVSFQIHNTFTQIEIKTPKRNLPKLESPSSWSFNEYHALYLLIRDETTKYFSQS